MVTPFDRNVAPLPAACTRVQEPRDVDSESVCLHDRGPLSEPSPGLHMNSKAPGTLREITVDHLILRLENDPGVYGFFLGAGCSRGAGIPSAREMIEEIYSRLGQDNVSPDVTYDRAMTELGSESGVRAYLRSQIIGKKPGQTHRELASIVEERFATAIFTTNFDHLIEIELATLDRPCIIISTDEAATIVSVHGELHKG